ncbi:hypothetical protein CEXT_416401 [Caerostris extrusa]|uniref:Uncharacterized protein n=1 Tax=Caerostris extrusa TaxID=172846 RepID=A0AAV4Y667_CAEEX|nr:hypothetical protein CEXT_416401 [Caerostris extrusa]
MEDLRHLHIFASGVARPKRRTLEQQEFSFHLEVQRRFRRLRGSFLKGKLASPLQSYWGNFSKTWAIVVPYRFQPSVHHNKRTKANKRGGGG